MKPFELTTRFGFGKYEGKTLEEIFSSDSDYIETCILNVEDFCVEEKAIQRLFEKYPDNEISDSAINTNLDKLDALGMDNSAYVDNLFSDEVLEADGDMDSVEEDEEYFGSFDETEEDENWKDDSDIRDDY